METPTQEQFDTVINNFKQALEKCPDAIVDMTEWRIWSLSHKNPAPMCHAGWYGWAIEKPNIGLSTIKMANDLGFKIYQELQQWAKLNPEIWGNENGDVMFTSGLAFDDKFNHPTMRFKLEVIIDHWKGVKERALHYDI